MKHVKTVSKRTRLVTGGAVAAALIAGTAGAVSAQASPASPATADRTAADRTDAAKPEAKSGGLVNSSHLGIDAAARAAQGALKAAEKENQHVSVAVVDRNGNTLVTLRGDGAGPQSYEAAEKKAFTAVSWNAPTSELTERLQSAPTLKDIPGTLFLAGGAPIDAKNAPVAGIGVAGAPSGDLDEKFAEAGAATVAK
ncbi:GlcG/HbpS family heme-binding protein [Streptomyces niger]|uniref:GlcG/HbpS family heme-binding protein n=1 Tax=Streptomyces niger TaxID=66373 RepID=UPI00069A82A2|nr:heme-binding protein [Streptomyces niger]